MKAAWYEKFGPADKTLCVGDLPDPQPVEGEVRVRMFASGVNPVDVKRRQGGRGQMSAPRVVPHFDGAGVIDAVGSGVDESRIGQRVWIYGAQWERNYGTAAEWIALPAENAVQLSESTSYAEGACLGIPALTAYPCVFADGSVRGQTLLVTGGAGNVGRYAIQFAKLSGARVIATVSTDEKAVSAASAGADHVLNYQEQEVATEIAKLTEGQGVDRIIEVEFGGNLETSVQVLKTGGTIATYASQAVPAPMVPFYELMYKSLVVRHVLTFQIDDQLLRQALVDINRWLEAGQLSHCLGPSYSLEQIVGSHQAVEQGAVGKVLIEFPG